MTVRAILGMHRSGTSLVAGLAARMGADLGPREQVMRPRPDNPHGFYEHLPIVRLNDRILEHFAGSWDRPPVLASNWAAQPGLESVRQDAKDILGMFADMGTSVVKDPRFSLTFPLWQHAGPIEGAIHVVRDPVAVAQSLRRRANDLPVDPYDLWWMYVSGAALAAPHAHVIVSDSILAAVDEHLRQIADMLDLAPTAGQVERARQFVDARSWHVAPALSPADRRAARFRDVFEWLAAGEPQAGLVTDLVPRSLATQTVGPREGVVGTADPAGPTLSQETRSLEAANADLKKRNRELSTALARVRSERDAARDTSRIRRSALEALAGNDNAGARNQEGTGR